MHHNDQLKDKLITYLRDAAAMEKEIEDILRKQLSDTKQFPEIQARIRQHADVTRTHRQRMEDRLKAYNESPSGVKSAVASLMGNLMGMTAGGRTDALAKEARDDYMIEHLEIAAYELLITTAAAYGDQETVHACELNLRDEIEMAQWLEQNLPRTALLSFQQDNIQITQAEGTTAEQTALNCLRQASGGAGGMYQQNAGQMPAQPAF